MDINTNSKLYKFIRTLSDAPIYENFIEVNNTFNDVCTLVRHLFYILIVSVILLFIGICFICVCIALFILAPYLGIKEYDFTGLVILSAEILAIITYITLLILQYIDRKNIIDFSKISFKPNDDSLIVSVMNVIAEKNNDVCKKINIINDDK